MPAPEGPQTKLQVKVGKEVLTEMVDRLGFAMSQDEGRPNLNGMFMKAEPADGGTRFEIVTTDGLRLGRLVRMVEGPRSRLNPWEALIHRKAVSTNSSVLDNTEGEVTLGFQRNAVSFSVESGYLLVHQIEMEFPDYSRVIPSGSKWSSRWTAMNSSAPSGGAGIVISPDKQSPWCV